jgi:two-component system cell cycle sensor histidine kinase/response regulator CckA
VGLALIGLGGLLFLRIGRPLVRSIQESEAQFRQVSEQSLTGIFIHQNGQLLYVNPCLARMLSYDPEQPEEYIGKPFIEFVHPEERERVADYVARRLKREDVPGQYATRLLARDGQQVWVEVMVNLIDVGGAPAAMGNILDITAQKEAEGALVEERNRVQNYLDIADVMLVAIDNEGRVTMINRKGCEVLGYPEAEIVGRNWFERFLPDQLRDEVQSVSQMILRGEVDPVKTYENPVLTSSGEERIIAWHNVDIRDEEGNVIGHLSSGEDITERKAAERERETLEAQLRQAMKMEAIGRLAGGVAHDFNNILTAIIGYAELVRAKISPHDPIGPDLDEIREAGERASALTGQLLAFSRKQIVVPKVIDLNTVIERGNRMISRIIGEDVELLFIPAETIWPVRMDPSQVDQLLINLATNARDAMPEGGKLTIETSPSTFSSDARRRADEEIAPGDYVMVAVSDSGSGMEPKTRDKIFEPFFTTKPKDRGTGLGLSTVYGIVKQAGGYIGVYSEPGLGTTFKMYFPRVDAEVRDNGDASVQEHPRGSETVLLVEDDEMVRTLTVRVLEKQGYRLITAGSGDEAIRLCREAGGEVDLLLTDVIMPAMNGRDLFIALRELQPDLNVLYMSGYTDEVVARHGILEEGTRLLAKPFSLREVSRAVRRALDET